MVLIRIHRKSSPATFTSPWRPFTKLSNTLLETEHSLSKSGIARLPTSGPAALIGLSGHEDADESRGFLGQRGLTIGLMGGFDLCEHQPREFVIL